MFGRSFLLVRLGEGLFPLLSSLALSFILECLGPDLISVADGGFPWSSWSFSLTLNGVCAFRSLLSVVCVLFVELSLPLTRVCA